MHMPKHEKDLLTFLKKKSELTISDENIYTMTEHV